MYKYFYYISWLTIVTAIGIIGLLSYWLLFPYKTVEFRNVPAKVETKVVKAGEDLSYKVEYCKYTDILPEINKKFVDGIIYSVPTVYSSTNRGCGVNKIQITVPKNLPEGKYSLLIVYRYKVNPIRTIDVTLQTEQFNVIK